MPAPSGAGSSPTASASRVSVAAFALVYGLAARQAGLSLVEGLAMSAIAFAGAAQFAALGLLAQGVPWLGIVVLTALLNARHLLYSASLAPWFAGRSRRERARLGVHPDRRGVRARAARVPGARPARPRTYLIAACFTFVPWVGATVAGHARSGSSCRRPTTLGLDVVFPAAMAGLAVALVVDRRALAAAVAGAVIGVAVALMVGPSVGILAGGLLGPAIALLVRETPAEIEAAETADATRHGGAAVSVELVALAVLMAAVTYPSRAVPLLLPGFDRLPPHRQRVPPAHRSGHPRRARRGQRPGAHR